MVPKLLDGRITRALKMLDEFGQILQHAVQEAERQLIRW